MCELGICTVPSWKSISEHNTTICTGPNQVNSVVLYIVKVDGVVFAYSSGRNIYFVFSTEASSRPSTLLRLVFPTVPHITCISLLVVVVVIIFTY